MKDFTELISEELPALVDHNEAGGIDLHRIAGAHDKAAAAHGHAVHDAGQFRSGAGKLPQAVMDHIACPGVAAVAVHANGDGLATGNLLQILQKLGQQNELPLNRIAPPVCGLLLVDVSVHGDFGGVVVHRSHRVNLF